MRLRPVRLCFEPEEALPLDLNKVFNAAWTAGLVAKLRRRRGLLRIGRHRSDYHDRFHHVSDLPHEHRPAAAQA